MNKKFPNKTFQSGLWIIAGFSLFGLLLHLYSNAFAHYGIFRDEMYYVACSNHLAAGYVDQPPFSIFILFLGVKLLGESIFALRLLPAIAAAFAVFFVGLITRRLGGGKTAITLSCLSTALAPQFLGMGTIFSMNVFDWLFWMLATYVVVLLIQSDLNSQPDRNKKLWIWLGIVLGLGLLNKIDLLWFGAGLFVGLLLTPQRKFLKTKWPYLAGIIAFILFSPYIIWNVTHNFATLEFMHRASSIKYASQNPGTFISGMIMVMNPLAIFVWLPGIYFLFFHKDGKAYRILGYIFVVTFLILIINWHVKSEYIAPAIPILLAAGSVMIEIVAGRKSFTWIKFALPVIIFLTGVLLIPMALPVLPPETFIEYSKALGQAPSTPEGKKLAELPQFYADMFGWENMAAGVSKVYTSLPPEEQQRAVVYGQNYGEAGAIDFFRNKYPLPPAYSGQNNYWYWGKADSTKDVVIIIGGNIDDHLKSLDSVVVAGKIKSKYAIPYESNLNIYVGRGFKFPFYILWQRVRFFI